MESAASEDPTPGREGPPLSCLLTLLVLLILCALVTLPFLGSTGLSSSEGHRVIPALTMLESGDYLVPSMFDQPYARKPQLVPWLFAGALSIHDNPDLSPRIVSVLAFTLMTLGSWFFARRWFGTDAALPAGIACALTPLFWSPARSAEIESVNNLLTALGAWITLELLLRTKKEHTPLWSIALGIAALFMLLTKGPAGFPIFLALIVASSILNRSPKPLFNPSILIPIAIAALLFVWHWSRTLTAAGPDVIIQSPAAFMFEPSRLLKLVGFIPVSLLTALPITLALLFPWGKDAKSESTESDQRAWQLKTAKALALSIPLSLLIMMLVGVSNDRYAQPILATIPPLVGWVLTTNLLPHRAKILRVFTLGSPKLLAFILVIGAILNFSIIEPNQRASSGKLPALQLAVDIQSALPAGQYTIIADAMIEARPETLLYLQQTLESTDHPLTIHWIPRLPGQQISQIRSDHPHSTLALIRTDPNGDESDKVLIDKVIATGTVHEFDFSLVVLSPSE